MGVRAKGTRIIVLGATSLHIYNYVSETHWLWHINGCSTRWGLGALVQGWVKRSAIQTVPRFSPLGSMQAATGLGLCPRHKKRGQNSLYNRITGSGFRL